MVAIAVFCIAAAVSSLVGLWTTSTASIRETYNFHLLSVARTAAQFIDPALHQSLRDPAQTNTPAYERAVAPLRRFLASGTDAHYIYTMVRENGEYRFVLDAALPGDADGDGIDDQARVWELYEDEDPVMGVAFGTPKESGRAVSVSQPHADKWGNFMTAWAPLVDADGVQYGALGVDVIADDYLAHLAAARRSALLGLLPAALVIFGLSLLFYRMRLRSLEASRRADEHARALADHQQRLGDVMDGTSVGTWEVLLGDTREADVHTVDARWAAMFGYHLEDLLPLTPERLAEMTYPGDMEAVEKTYTRSMEGDGGLFIADMRVRHADGHWIWAETRGRVVERDATGKPRRMVGMLIDVTARKKTEAALQDSERSLRSLFELSPAGICQVDMASGRFLRVNNSLVSSTGYTREELLQLSYFEVTPQEWHDFEHRQLEVIRHRNDFGPYEKEYLRKDGTRYPVLISGLCVRDGSGRQLAWAIVQDISERKIMELELADAARRDRLTGLANRAAFLEWLESSLDQVRRGLQDNFAVLFLDFDRFKLVNDAMGHDAGDALLRDIAERLRETLREGSEHTRIARFGGDEFLVLLNDLPDLGAAETIATRLLASLSRAYLVQGREVHSSASIGIVTSAQGVESAEAVVRNADVAMYEAKRSGRACAVVYDESMRLKLTRHVQIENYLRKSLGTPEISLEFQPIVELESGRIISVEALARWQHPTLGTVSAAEFIPVAEESDLVVELGNWVLQEACHRLAQWRLEQGESAPQTISVNISRAELAQGNRLLERVRGALQNAGLPPECLLLEVTEREVMRDPPGTLRLMQSLHKLGVRLAMDDFGTGTSSLGCLRDYPFDVIKIDRSFVHDVASSADMLAVIHATVTLVENLGRTSVAEGVETHDQVAVLQSLGCHYAQGYYFSRPVPAADFAHLLSRGVKPLLFQDEDIPGTRAVQ